MIKKRSSLEMRVDILQIIMGGTSKPTHVMYEANTSFQPLMREVNILVEKGLMEMLDDTTKDRRTHTRFVVTVKGRYALRAYRLLQDLEDG